MARKKKNISKEILVNDQEKNYNLSDINNSELVGNVTLKIKQGNRLIKSINVHNTGTLNLFYGLTLALSGSLNYNIDYYLPKYLGAGVGVELNQDKAILLTNLVEPIQMTMPTLNLFTSPMKDTINKQAIVTFQGVIPYRSIGNTEIREIGVYGVNNVLSGTLLSRIQFDGIKLEQGQSLYVDWTYGIRNLSNDLEQTSTSDANVSENN